MLLNAYFLAKFRSDTAENEPAKNLQNFANYFPNFANPNPGTRAEAPAVVNSTFPAARVEEHQMRARGCVSGRPKHRWGDGVGAARPVGEVSKG